jgi:hypothetical protein
MVERILLIMHHPYRLVKQNAVSDFPETGSDPPGTVSPVCNIETKEDPPHPSGMPLAPGKS